MRIRFLFRNTPKVCLHNKKAITFLKKVFFSDNRGAEYKHKRVLKRKEGSSKEKKEEIEKIPTDKIQLSKMRQSLITVGCLPGGNWMPKIQIGREIFTAFPWASFKFQTP